MRIKCNHCEEIIESVKGSFITCGCWNGKKGVALDEEIEGAYIRVIGDYQEIEDE